MTVLDHEAQRRTVTQEEDPLECVVAISRRWKPVRIEGIPHVFTGGWVGYCGYDTVRYVYGGKRPAVSCCSGRWSSKGGICWFAGGANRVARPERGCLLCV